MKKDTILIGTAAGMIGALAKDVPNLILYKLKVVHSLYFQLAASAHLLPRDVNTLLAFIIGILGNLITGGCLGMVAILVIEHYGGDYWWYKGIMIGAIVWLFGMGVALNLGTIHLVPTEPIFRLTSIIDHLIFGLTTVYFIQRWRGRPKRKK